MKNKKILVGMIIAIAIIIIAIICLNRTSSIFSVENNDDGSINVESQKAAKNASGIGYITLEEGQKMEVRTNLTDNSVIKIEILPANVDATTKVLMEETFTAIDAREFELPSGEYTIRITAEKGATGSMNIHATGEMFDLDKNGTAGSNIALKDNYDEAEYQIEVAMQYLLEKAYGDEIVDARIYVQKIYTAEEEQEIEPLKEMNLGPDEVAFEVKYELKPAEDVEDVMKFTAATGEYDEETGWVIEKYNLGILRPTESGEPKYEITDFGTGW